MRQGILCIASVVGCPQQWKPSWSGHVSQGKPTVPLLCTSRIVASTKEIQATADVTCRDFALISEQDVCLSPGFNVITGESGSGKSVLLAALNQALGAPAHEDFIRSPSDTATVQIVFRLSSHGMVSIDIQLLCTNRSPGIAGHLQLISACRSAETHLRLLLRYLPPLSQPCSLP